MNFNETQKITAGCTTNYLLETTPPQLSDLNINKSGRNSNLELRFDVVVAKSPSKCTLQALHDCLIYLQKKKNPTSLHCLLAKYLFFIFFFFFFFLVVVFNNIPLFSKKRKKLIESKNLIYRSALAKTGNETQSFIEETLTTLTFSTVIKSTIIFYIKIR